MWHIDLSEAESGKASWKKVECKETTFPENMILGRNAHVTNDDACVVLAIIT